MGNAVFRWKYVRDYCISNFVPYDTTSALQGAVLRVSVSFNGEVCITPCIGYQWWVEGLL